MIQTPSPPHIVIPFIRDTPLLGSMMALKKDRLDFLLRLAQTGSVVGFHTGPFPVVAISTPEYIYSLLVERANDFDKGWFMHRAFVGNGIFISEGGVHARQRKIMAPCFQPRQVASYAEIMAVSAERLIHTWHDGQKVSLSQQMNAVTLSIISQSLFGVDLFREADPLGGALIVAFNHAAHMVMSPFALPPNWPTPYNRKKDRAWAVIRTRLQALIDERRASPENHHDFLSLLLQARDEDGKPMDDTQIMDEASTLFTGGQETVANALIWTWILLCQHPHIYDQLQHEIDHVLGGRIPTPEDLKQLPFCQMTFKEALRLYPPAPVVIRQALSDTLITAEQNGDSYLIKKGTTVIASIFAIQRTERFFPRPNDFDPERHFAPEHETCLPRYAFLPFGTGPRICIGNHFAMMEGMLLLATIASRVRFELVADQQIGASSQTLTTKPQTDIKVIVHFR